MDANRFFVMGHFAKVNGRGHNAGVHGSRGIDEPKRDWRPAIVSALAAIVVFCVALKGTYIYDDCFIVAADTRVSHPSQWGKYWTEGYFPDGVDNLYRPLTSMSFALQWWINGDRPWAFHLVNVLLYGACAAAVAELARRMGGGTVAYVAGLLFAVHPIHTEVVAGVVGRADLLCTLTFLGALILMAGGALTIRRVLAIFVCCVISLLSKEQGLLLPLVLLLFGVCGRTTIVGRWPRLADFRLAGRRSGRAVQWLALLLCWTWAGYLIFRERVLPMEWDRSLLDWTQNPMIRARGWSIWLMPIEMLGRYVQLLIVPWKLSIDYGGRVIGWVVHGGDPYLYLGLGAIVMWVVLVIVAWRRRWGMPLFCLLMAALTWGMVSNLGVYIGTNFGERLMFLPSVFFLILAAMAMSRLPRRALAPLLAGLLVLGSLRSVTYARRWNNRLAFYEYSLKNQPKSVRCYLLVGMELMQQGKLEQAADVMQRAKGVEPDYWAVWTGAFDIAIKRHRPDEAQVDLDKAWKIVPNPTFLWGRSKELDALIRESKTPRRPSDTDSSRPATHRATDESLRGKP